MAKQGVLFEENFLDKLAGYRILHCPRTAVIELVANSWDAGATKVNVSWPNLGSSRTFSITDNGEGMTEDEFCKRWRTLTYDRVKEQGLYAIFPDNKKRPQRLAFGRNGLGRLAGFCFGNDYIVETKKAGECSVFRVSKGLDQPLEIELIEKKQSKGHGTKIYAEKTLSLHMDANDARREIGMRFLTDPDFRVLVNKVKVGFAHIPESHIIEQVVPVEEIGDINVIAIDTQQTDKTMQQHGVAWHVNGRLVGNCTWKTHEGDDLIDGRRIAAKRYTFIVKADVLSDIVSKDWSGFDLESEKFHITARVAYEYIRMFLCNHSKEDRKEVYKKARTENYEIVKDLPLRSVNIWKRFVAEIQLECPSIKERDVLKLSKVLAHLEESESKYSLIHRLGELKPNQLDGLDEILSDWTLDMAKVVLDEIQGRLKLLDELKRKVLDEKTDEVAELQPLFKQGLWIFGPEYETIEYTSNEGMTTVIQKLFGKKIKGTRNRPDFAILPDGTAGLYSLSKYDPKTGSEIGIDKLIIVELKKPGITISADQKDQCWKYVKELYKKGLLKPESYVVCFPLGSQIDPLEVEARTEKGEHVIIQPLDYQTIIQRAKSRMLKLYDKVKDAPFLNEDDKNELNEYIKGVDDTEDMTLFDVVESESIVV